MRKKDVAEWLGKIETISMMGTLNLYILMRMRIWSPSTFLPIQEAILRMISTMRKKRRSALKRSRIGKKRMTSEFSIVEMKDELSSNLGREIDLRTPEDISKL